MNIVLVPGFWLGDWSWKPITDKLTQAGHTVHALTLPGLESDDEPRGHVSFDDHVRAITDEIDSIADASEDEIGDTDIVLVGHSGGGPLIYAATDRRPSLVARDIYVDSGPLADGSAINPNIPAVDGECPLPPWDFFDADELAELTPEMLNEFRTRAVPEPAAVTSDLVVLSDDQRRLDVPATVITSTFSSTDLREAMHAGHPYFAELARVRDVTVVDLPTGHWPQFSRPAELAEAILAALR
ncbi:alpha/beta fold hydrolase [Subtercola frigoramans]|uniref:Pimeloyl-ACP methyl ester carboxylesterase n=1 Tax=Subtercola frigoramans TaxID=120298 RepID=A0ABS2L018_9MICO|nr:alpha/beta hydrolase [Subtercola frigoramans]MBM7470418.1 pimeloyl-ACP methyl ester carboxylesterase [Subtercola frigoramans]